MNSCRAAGLPPHPDAAMVRRLRRPVPWQKQAGERIRVVDIFDEVEEDLRAERAEKLLKKYAWLLIAVVVAIVAAAGWWPVGALHQMSATGPAGYKTLARLRAATLKADAGDLQGDESLWNAVASDSGADQ